MATHLIIFASILAITSIAAAFPGYHGHIKPSLRVPILTPVQTPVLTPVQAPMATPVASPAQAPMATPVASPAHAPMATPVTTPAHTPMATPVATPAHHAPKATPAHHAPKATPGLAPSQGADCSEVVYDLVTCVSYMTIPAEDSKPSKECCESLLSIMKADAECVCVALDTAPSMGFQVNYTRALSLSKACHLNVPHVDCHINMSPSEAPNGSPAVHHAPSQGAPSTSSPMPKHAHAPVGGSIPIAEAPAASPAQKASGSSSVSSSTALVSMIVAALCYTLG